MGALSAAKQSLKIHTAAGETQDCMAMGRGGHDNIVVAGRRYDAGHFKCNAIRYDMKKQYRRLQTQTKTTSYTVSVLIMHINMQPA